VTIICLEADETTLEFEIEGVTYLLEIHEGMAAMKLRPKRATKNEEVNSFLELFAKTTNSEFPENSAWNTVFQMLINTWITIFRAEKPKENWGTDEEMSPVVFQKHDSKVSSNYDENEWNEAIDPDNGSGEAYAPG